MTTAEAFGIIPIASIKYLGDDLLRDLQKELEEIERLNSIIKNGFEIEHIRFEDSAVGRQLSELQKLRHDFDEYVRSQEAQRKADEERRKIERKRNLIGSLAAGSVTGIISGVFVYYWPAISGWAMSLLH